MPTVSRVVGSGFTTLTIAGKVLALLDSFADSGQQPYQAPYEDVYSIGNNYADEIVQQRVLAPGSLTCTIREAWHAPVWKSLLVHAGFTERDVAGLNNVIDAYGALDRIATPLTAQMIIRNPNPRGGTRGKVYHGLTLIDIGDGENVSVGALSLNKTITFRYIKATNF